MRLYILFIAVFSALSFIKMEAQTPPYSGTIFIDPDIITSSDPSSIQSTTYAGRGQRQVFDRRVDKFVNIDAYLFDVKWKDGILSEAVVNPEFRTVELAKVEAEKYARLIGQLPSCLRLDVDQIWIHQGVQPFGGGNKSILIYTGQSAVYEADGIIEETLVHEAAHTSLDFAHAASSGWKTAQSKDGNFISTYARDNPTGEDIAESFLPWLMVKYRASKISTTDFNKITQTIPNRLAYFDSQSFNLYPFFGTADRPDYQVTSFTGPTQAKAGETITVTAVVKNFGTIAPPAAQLAAATDGIGLLTGDGLAYIEGGYFRSPTKNIGPGQQITITGSLTIPPNLTPGTYLVAYYTDGDEKIDELEEDKNFATYTITITKGADRPDYQVTSYTGPTQAKAGESITFTAVVKNFGTIAPPAAQLAAAFDAYALLDSDGFLIEGTYLKSPTKNIGPGQQVTITGSLTIPPNLTPGTYLVAFFTDDSQKIDELEEDKNFATYTITITKAAARPDYQVTSFTGPTQAKAGETITVTAVVKNFGTIAPPAAQLAAATDGIGLLTGDGLAYIEGGYFRSPTKNIGPGQQITITGSLTIPPNLTPGTYLVAYYTDGDEKIDELEEDKNFATYTITITKAAKNDCSNAVTLTPGQVYNGNTANGTNNWIKYNNDPFWQETGPEVVHQINWPGGVLNVKLSNRSAALDVILLRSCDPNDYIDGRAMVVNEHTMTNDLAAGTYYIVVDGWDGAVGTYTLTIGNAAAVDFCEGNTSSRVLQCGGSVDYDIFSTDASKISQHCGQAGYTGGERVYKIDWKGGTMEARLEGQAGQELILYSDCDPGKCIMIGGTLLRSTQPAGTYYLVVDGKNGAFGKYSLSINDADAPCLLSDFKAESIEGPSCAVPGSSITVTVRLGNLGKRSATAAELMGATDRIYLYASGKNFLEGVELINLPSKLILPGQILTFPTTFQIPAGTAPGDYDISYVANVTIVNGVPQGKIVEITPANNQASYPITIGNNSGPDYLPTDFKGPEAAIPGETIGLTLNLKNQGSAAGTGTGGKDKFYLNTVNNLKDGKPIELTPQSTFNTSNLAAGQVVSNVTAKVTLPANMLPGTWYILFHHDADNKVTECNEANNVEAHKIEIRGSTEPDWTVVETGDNHTVIIEANVPTDIKGVPLAVGDYIGAFYMDGNVLKCGGKARWTGQTIAITVFGDESGGVKDGFANGEAFQWRIWQASTKTEFEAKATYKPTDIIITHQGNFAIDGISAIASVVLAEKEQVITLKPGWNLISTYVKAEQPNIATLFSAIKSSIALVKDAKGKVYLPSSNLNTIGSWTVTEGYKVKSVSSANIDLVIKGKQVDPQTPINLNAGWNIMAYLKETPQNAANALASIKSQILLVKDIAGKVYLPSSNLNTIGELKPGQAYQIKVTSAVTLTYPAAGLTEREPKEEALISLRSNPVEPEWPVVETGDNHTIILEGSIATDFMKDTLKVGDYVGVFYNNGGVLKCGGKAKWTGESIAIAAFGDDTATPAKDGFKPGDKFIWRVWRAADSTEFRAVATYGDPNIIISQTDTYTNDGISEVKSLVQDMSTSVVRLEAIDIKVFPNPSSGLLWIELPAGIGTARVKVFNATGQVVLETVNKGQRKMPIDLQGRMDGLYIIQVKTNKQTGTYRIVLNK